MKSNRPENYNRPVSTLDILTGGIRTFKDIMAASVFYGEDIDVLYRHVMAPTHDLYLDHYFLIFTDTNAWPKMSLVEVAEWCKHIHKRDTIVAWADSHDKCILADSTEVLSRETGIREAVIYKNLHATPPISVEGYVFSFGEHVE